MPEQLLDRQARLLEHLTSSAGIFSAARGISNDPALHGLNLGLLHMEARFSHEKRMQKIEWVLTETLKLLGTRRDAVVRDFVEACPPTGISWLQNARQFHDFLKARWRCESPEPAYLPDIAAYELACASVRASEYAGAAYPDAAIGAPPRAVRRHPGTVLLRCCHDIRPILEGKDDVPQARETRFAIALPSDADEPVVSNLSAELFELLEMFDEFIEIALFDDMPESTKLIEDLVARGLVEVRG